MLVYLTMYSMRLWAEMFPDIRRFTNKIFIIIITFRSPTKVRTWSVVPPTSMACTRNSASRSSPKFCDRCMLPEAPSGGMLAERFDSLSSSLSDPSIIFSCRYIAVNNKRKMSLVAPSSGYFVTIHLTNIARLVVTQFLYRFLWQSHQLQTSTEDTLFSYCILV